ncbi:MAG: DUF5103 domain-containing protein [Bacteroidia bacterium]|jgi:hypothetical protein|nr:DUF5103 domain-containing protein [Bacteroidia bacterium]
MKNLLFVLLFLPLLGHAAVPDTTVDYFSDKSIRYDDRVYEPAIHTVILSSNPGSLSDATLRLGTDDVLYLLFDDLDGDFKNYSYTVQHCTYDWQPSNNLSVGDFIDGFMDQPITDYRFSRNTLQKFTNYRASFPHDNFKLLLSGNYLLKVYRDNDPEKLIITRRFIVSEELVSITGSVHPATIVGDRNFKQEVDFKINTGAVVSNPFTEIKPVIRQNGRWDNAVINMQPQFVNGSEITYDYEDVNVFRGGNEFRWFDTRTLRLQSERVQQIEMGSDGRKHVYLLTDEKRTYKRYMNNPDLNGRFMINSYDGGDSITEADYVYVHFFLKWELPTDEGDIYVFGAMSDWQFRPEMKMTYNYEKRGYEASILLKQGYYNYEFVLRRDNVQAADDFFVEGMHQETENTYVVYVYQRRPGARYDRLVGIKRFTTRPQ